MNSGVEARYSEYWLRACFQEAAQSLVAERQKGNVKASSSSTEAPSADMASLYVEQVCSSSPAGAFCPPTSLPSSHITTYSHLSLFSPLWQCINKQLRSGTKASEKEMIHILQQLQAFAADEARLTKLLSMLPASSPTGSLTPIAGALFHPNASVRTLAASLLKSIEGHKASQPCVSGLNPFLLGGFKPQEGGGAFA